VVSRLPAANALAALRIAVGALFVIFGESKVFDSWFTADGGFQTAVESFIQQGVAYPFMVPALETIVLPYGRFLAFVVAYGELAIGLSLVTGVLARTASGLGAVYMVSLIFSASYPGQHVAFWRYFGFSLQHLVFLLCFVTFTVSESAETWSLPASRWWLSLLGSRRAKGSDLQ
jgi:thiosulfate dehydrogenase (quinone) large subunit